MKFKARRRSLSPMERVGSLLSQNITGEMEEKYTDEKFSNKATDGEKQIKVPNSNGNIEQTDSITTLQPRRHVIPAKRLKSIIPEDYWKTETEDTKTAVDDLGSNVDTKEENKD